MDFAQIKELLALVDQSTLREFHLQMDHVVVQMSKNSHEMRKNEAEPLTAERKAPLPESTQSAKASNTFSNEEIKELVPTSNPEGEAEGEYVRSPIVGVAYLSPSPDEPAFKKVGDQVAVGETLCIIEAMKVMNEIKSEVSGTITEVFVTDEQVVEYHQPLFRIS